jgi:ribosomal-protein-alanine N-acetyltransferase
VKLRKAQVDDVKWVAKLAEESRLRAWPIDDYRAAIVDPSFDVRILVSGVSHRIGYYLSRSVVPDLELLQIAISPGSRGRGLGRRLLMECLCRAKEAGCSACYLEVRKSDSNVVSFYARQGFRIVGLRREYYSGPLEDALVMKLGLNASD